jgi:acyl carrier protein
MEQAIETQHAIRDFVLQQFPQARQRSIADDDLLLESGIIDSMGILEIVTFIESHFGIVLTDEEVAADSFESIAALASFVETKLDSPLLAHPEN